MKKHRGRPIKARSNPGKERSEKTLIREEAIERGRRRRRREDILEAARLEREALHDVWELDGPRIPLE